MRRPWTIFVVVVVVVKHTVFFLFECIPAGALSTFLFRLRRQKLDIWCCTMW